MRVVAADLNEAAAQAVVDAIKSARGYAVASGFEITEEASFKAHRLHRQRIRRFSEQYTKVSTTSDIVDEQNNLIAHLRAPV
jgi:hypothetical protein